MLSCETAKFHKHSSIPTAIHTCTSLYTPVQYTCIQLCAGSVGFGEQLTMSGYRRRAKFCLYECPYHKLSSSLIAWLPWTNDEKLNKAQNVSHTFFFMEIFCHQASSEKNFLTVKMATSTLHATTNSDAFYFRATVPEIPKFLGTVKILWCSDSKRQSKFFEETIFTDVQVTTDFPDLLHLPNTWRVDQQLICSSSTNILHPQIIGKNSGCMVCNLLLLRVLVVTVCKHAVTVKLPYSYNATRSC